MKQLNAVHAFLGTKVKVSEQTMITGHGCKHCCQTIMKVTFFLNMMEVDKEEAIKILEVAEKNKISLLLAKQVLIDIASGKINQPTEDTPYRWGYFC